MAATEGSAETPAPPSTPESPPPVDQMEKARQRVADALIGLSTAGHAVGLGQHQENLAQHAQMVRDSHRMGARAVGMEDLVGKDAAPEMGNIIITGDITHPQPDASIAALLGKQPMSTPASQPAAAAVPTPAAPPGAAQAQPQVTALLRPLLSKYGPWLLSAALGGLAAWFGLSKTETPAPQQQQLPNVKWDPTLWRLEFPK